MDKFKLNIFVCNGAKIPRSLKNLKYKNIAYINYDIKDENTLLHIGLPNFVTDVRHLSNNVKDLLEIASFVYAADRMTYRGDINSVEYNKWSRSFHFIIKVRDFEFWNQSTVKIKLSKALKFISGDKDFSFTFEKDRPIHENDLFDKEEFKFNPINKIKVILFSGGLDSLSGVLDSLINSNNDICLVSHKSSQPGITHTQKEIVKRLKKDFPNRFEHYLFKCNLTRIRAAEETQRTRSFLYSCIAFALSTAYSKNEFYFYENGMTSINFLDRQDLINSRASRTTHPQSLGLISDFLKEFNPKFNICQPYFDKTKTDVVEMFKILNKEDYISSAVSCSRTFLKDENHSHCGGCSQCIERIFAVYSNSMEKYDGELGLYNFNFIKDDIPDEVIKNQIIDYVRLALEFSKMNIDNFYSKKLEDLELLSGYVNDSNEDDLVNIIFELVKRHSNQIETAIDKMRMKYDKPFKENAYTEKSFLNLVKDKSYFKEPIVRFVEKIIQKINTSIPIAYKNRKPFNENELNDFINALLVHEKENYEREYPVIKFSNVKTIPDHSFNCTDLLLESKYLRDKISLSSITDEIASDIIKYKNYNHLLFNIYDPERKITNDNVFKKDYEINKKCTINIIR
ncbi:MAG: hypothetical protein EHM58_18735 [Ignavibacteriae bacterium]|nr:MAG: hypothetical protein EHM58_18735 [Ignavibacteriota bacterium]